MLPGMHRCGKPVTIREMGWGPVALCSQCAAREWVKRNRVPSPNGRQMEAAARNGADQRYERQ